MIKLKKARFFLAFVALIATVGNTSESTDRLRYLLDTADCTLVRENQGLRLHAMKMFFPLQKGYDFYGYELGRLSFRKFGADREVRSYADAKAAAYEYSQQMASVKYYESEQSEDLGSEEYEVFEEFEWRDFSLLYYHSEQTSSSKQPISHNQVIARVAGEVERLWFSSPNLENISNIIACASADKI